MTCRPSAPMIFRVDPAPGRFGEARSVTMYPDFLVIGAQKAGTTWLHRNLRNHPETWMPRNEVHYFDRKINDRSFDDAWYASIFEKGRARGKTVGEYTPSYSVVDRKLVAHAHKLMPEAKIIFSMRNPVERAWSQANMTIVRRERGTDHADEEDLRGLFDREKAQLRTNYLRSLDNWGAYFPPERIFVSFLEDIHFHPERLLEDIYGFLGVDPEFRPEKMNKRINSRSSDVMPTWAASYLAGVYRDIIRQLDERFGGYASFWRYSTERLIEDPPPGESITYPLWDSPLREDWSEGPGDPDAFGEDYLQSGPLSSIQIPG